MLVGQHALFLSAGAPPLLPPFLFAGLLLGALAALLLLEEAFREHAAGEPTVDFAGTVFAAADLESGRGMEKAHDGRGLVGLLSAGAASQNEGLLEILLVDEGLGHEGLDFGDCLRGHHSAILFPKI